MIDHLVDLLSDKSGMPQPHIWFCTSMGSCFAGFVHWSIPYMQWIALALSIYAGVKAALHRK